MGVFLNIGMTSSTQHAPLEPVRVNERERGRERERVRERDTETEREGEGDGAGLEPTSNLDLSSGLFKSFVIIYTYIHIYFHIPLS